MAVPVTSMFTVRKAVRERLQSSLLDDVTYYWQLPEFVVTPAIMIQPDFPTANFETAFSSRTTTWFLVVNLVMDWIDEDEAQEQLSTWLDIDGPVIGALLSDDITDSLSALATDIRVTVAGDFDKTAMGGTMVAFAKLRLQIKA